MKRPGTPSLSMQLECLFKRFPIVCHICSERIDWDVDRDWDHVVEHQESGVHTAEALAPVHRSPCHRVKSGKKLSERRHIDRLEKEKNGLPKRKRQSRPMKSGKTVWPKRAFPRQCA